MSGHRSFAVAVAALLVLVGCSPERVRSVDAYCDLVAAHGAALIDPPLTTADDIHATVALFARLHGAAPVAVEPEWAVLEQLVRAAAEIDQNDPAAAADLATKAREARLAADHVVSYTNAKCNVSFGLNPTPGSAPELPGAPPTSA